VKSPKLAPLTEHAAMPLISKTAKFLILVKSSVHTIRDRKNGNPYFGTFRTFGLLKIEQIYYVWKDIEKMQKMSSN
jgi:hypothetical protein